MIREDQSSPKCHRLKRDYAIVYCHGGSSHSTPEFSARPHGRRANKLGCKDCVMLQGGISPVVEIAPDVVFRGKATRGY